MLNKNDWLDKPLAPLLSKISIEHVLIAMIILITLISRFYDVGLRVMSHDEVNHVVPSYDLYVGRGYRHDPVTHGPLQFHLIAFSYFLLGDSDFSSRVPAALFSTAAVVFVLIFFRRYLGRKGGLLSGLFFMISPFMLFYGRYARNEAFIMLFGVVMLYAVLRYLEGGKRNWVYLLTLSISLHFCTKETSYIYVAQLLIFLAAVALYDLSHHPWQSRAHRNQFTIFTTLAAFIFISAMVISIIFIRSSAPILQPAVGLASPTVNLAVATQQMATYFQTTAVYFFPVILPLVISLILLMFIRKQLGWQQLNEVRSFNLLILVGTLILPLLSAIPTKLAGIDPVDYTNQLGIYTTFIFMLYLSLSSFILGSAWMFEEWWKNAVVFYVPFILFFTTFFSNGFGFFTGVVGALGYWMAQHGLQRGGQPLYYYALIQIPIYEFLAASGTLLALKYAIKNHLAWRRNPTTSHQPSPTSVNRQPPPVMALLLYWSFSSLLVYSIAGEKMPWLSVHIALPMLLCAGLALGRLIQSISIRRSRFKFFRAMLTGLLLIISVGNVFVILLGSQPPFQGKTQVQLERTNYFLFSILLSAGLAYILYRFTLRWRRANVLRLLTLSVFALLILLTIRTSYRASFINYDYPLEYLVYAHSASGPKEVLSQVEEISRRTTRGLDIKVAYDNWALYPYWWYLRNYPNRIAFMENFSRTLEEAPIIIVGMQNYSKIEPIVRNNYYVFEYMRLWWPNMDYYNLTGERIAFALTNADMRQALFNIWFNRDYTLYGQITNNSSLTLENWSPAERMRLYIRKDIAAQIWDLGVSTGLTEMKSSDPYLEKITEIQPDRIISGGGNVPGLLMAPHGMAFAVDGSLYVADSLNHRIQHFSNNGDLITSWGSYANVLEGDAPGGTFNEPWGVAVGPDGSVYVADTWNHRIQKFTADGQFITMWGSYLQGSETNGLYGPRGIVVDQKNHVYVTDTGNKRVLIYDANGNYLSEFGSEGMAMGNLDEPVGIALDTDGKIYIADTWNRRIQVFQSDESGLYFTAVSSWEVDGWYGQSTNNKPFLTLSPLGNVLVTDPEGTRILEFSPQGEFLRGWSGFNLSADLTCQPSALAFDDKGSLWVSDASNSEIMVFDSLP